MLVQSRSLMGQLLRILLRSNSPVSKIYLDGANRSLLGSIGVAESMGGNPFLGEDKRALPFIGLSKLGKFQSIIIESSATSSTRSSRILRHEKLP